MRFSPHASSKAGQKRQSKITWYFKCVCLPQPSPRWRRDKKIPPLVLLCKHKQWLTGCCEITGWSRCIGSHTLKTRFVPSTSAPLFPELKSQLSYSEHCGALLLWGNMSNAAAVSQPMASALLGRGSPNAPSPVWCCSPSAAWWPEHPLFPTPKYISVCPCLYTLRKDVGRLISVEHHRKKC